MKLDKVVAVATLLVSLTGQSLADDLSQKCFTSFSEDDAKALITTASDGHYAVCFMGDTARDSTDSAIGVTVRDIGVSTEIDIRNGVRTIRGNDATYLKLNDLEIHGPSCAIFAAKRGQVVSVVRTAGTPEKKVIRFCALGM